MEGKRNLVVLLLAVICVMCLITPAQSEMSQGEYESVKWIAQQYRADMNLTDIKCGLSISSVSIRCNANSSAIIGLSISYSNKNIDIGYPDTNMSIMFSFPELANIYIGNTGPSRNASLNIFEKFGNGSAPMLQYLTIRDYNVSYIPNLSGLTSLVSFDCDLPLITYIPRTIFFHKTITQIYLEYSPIEYIEAPIAGDVTNINSLQTGVGGINNVFSMNLTYPKIEILNLYLLKPNLTVKVDTTLKSSTQIFSKGNGGNVVLSGSVTSLTVLVLIGPFDSILPANLSIYNRLSSLQLISYNTSDFPFTNPGSQIFSFEYSQSNITEFPIFQAMPPSIYRGCAMRRNQFKGSIPLQYYDIWGRLELEFNPGINGSIPKEACRLAYLDISYTGIQDMADCFKCYFKTQDLSFEPYEAYGTPFYYNFYSNASSYPCNITYTPHLISYDAQTVTVIGDNLGWAKYGDCDTNITLMDINTRFVYMINPDETSAHIALSKIANRYIDITYEIRTIMINKATMDQLIYNISIVVDGNFTLPNIPHNVTVQGVNCTNVQINATRITCILPTALATGFYDVVVSNQYNTVVYNSNLNLRFPIVTSISRTTVQSAPVTMVGSFGNIFTDLYVYINNQTCANPVVNQTVTICDLPSGLETGYATLYMTINKFPFISNSLVYIFGMDQDGIADCIKNTNNCTNGNGICQVDGTCQCIPGFQGVSCDQVISNNTVPNSNSTSPNISFNDTTSGYSFNFSMVSIREVDLYENTIQELFINDSWNVTSTSESSTFRLINYQFKSNSSGIYGNVVNEKLVVTSKLYFTNVSTSIEFANQTISLAPSSIKLSVNITNWKYKSLLNTLVVVFSTPINVDECFGNPLSFTYDPVGKNIQYLRFVQDGVEYLGKFTKYSLSNNRPTFTGTQLLNSTGSVVNGVTNALIGVHLPQCDECILDPDFSALINVKKGGGIGMNGRSTCTDVSESKEDNKWKIIVGCVVGGVAALALAIGGVILKKKQMVFKAHENRMKKKLSAVNQQH